jgi:hypothetical protein
MYHTCTFSLFRNNVAKLDLNPLRRSGKINNNVLRLGLLLDLQSIHCRSAATLETVTEKVFLIRSFNQYPSFPTMSHLWHRDA